MPFSNHSANNSSRKSSPPKLSELLCLYERKDRAMNLIKMVELGFLPSVADPSVMKKISDMHDEEFLFLLGRAAKTTGLQKHEGSFSTALIDFGNGPVDCVIKVGVGDFGGQDKGYEYLRYSQKVGGRKHSTALPDVYYAGTVKTANRDVDIAVIEFVNVNMGSEGKTLANKLNRLVNVMYNRWGLNWHDDLQVEDEMKHMLGIVEERQHLLQLFGWSIQDMIRFVVVLGKVGGSVDIHRGNLGLRQDNTVCVFDPISG